MTIIGATECWRRGPAGLSAPGAQAQTHSTPLLWAVFCPTAPSSSTLRDPNPQVASHLRPASGCGSTAAPEAPASDRGGSRTSCCESRECSNVFCVHHSACSGADLARLQQDACASVTTPASPGLRPLVTNAHICSLSSNEQRVIIQRSASWTILGMATKPAGRASTR